MSDVSLNLLILSLSILACAVAGFVLGRVYQNHRQESAELAATDGNDDELRIERAKVTSLQRQKDALQIQIDRIVPEIERLRTHVRRLEGQLRETVPPTAVRSRRARPAVEVRGWQVVGARPRPPPVIVATSQVAADAAPAGDDDTADFAELGDDRATVLEERVPPPSDPVDASVVMVARRSGHRCAVLCSAEGLVIRGAGERQPELAAFAGLMAGFHRRVGELLPAPVARVTVELPAEVHVSLVAMAEGPRWSLVTMTQGPGWDTATLQAVLRNLQTDLAV